MAGELGEQDGGEDFLGGRGEWRGSDGPRNGFILIQ